MAHATAQREKIERKRIRDFGEDATLVLYRGAQAPYTAITGGELEDGWYLRQVTDIKTGQEIFKCWVYDEDGTRKQKLRDATVFLISRVFYKKLAPDPPIGSIPLWDFALQPVGILPSSSPSASVSPSA